MKPISVTAIVNVEVGDWCLVVGEVSGGVEERGDAEPRINKLFTFQAATSTLLNSLLLVASGRVTSASEHHLDAMT